MRAGAIEVGEQPWEIGCWSSVKPLGRSGELLQSYVEAAESPDRSRREIQNTGLTRVSNVSGHVANCDDHRANTAGVLLACSLHGSCSARSRTVPSFTRDPIHPVVGAVLLQEQGQQDARCSSRDRPGCS